jgi:hypothetical protein
MMRDEKDPGAIAVNEGEQRIFDRIQIGPTKTVCRGYPKPRDDVKNP